MKNKQAFIEGLDIRQDDNGDWCVYGNIGHVYGNIDNVYGNIDNVYGKIDNVYGEVRRDANKFIKEMNILQNVEGEWFVGGDVNGDIHGHVRGAIGGNVEGFICGSVFGTVVGGKNEDNN